MKKRISLLTSIVLFLAFTSCEKESDPQPEPQITEDVTDPEITCPSDQLDCIDLGDKEMAMTGVTALDNEDGDITDLIEIENLDKAGEVTLIYSVSDKAGNRTTKERPATIKTDKLAGDYTYTMDEDPTLYQCHINQSPTVFNEIFISNVISGEIAALCQDTTFQVEEIALEVVGMGMATLSGNGSFEKINGIYQVKEAKIIIMFEDDEMEWEMNLSFEKEL